MTTFPRIALCLVLVALVLAGCGTARVDSDWCYYFDFTASDYASEGMTINQGTYTPGAGFSPDGVGNFDFEYDHGATVTPEQVMFKFNRQGSLPPVEVRASASAFGFFSGFRQTLVPAGEDSAHLSLFPGSGPGSSALLIVAGHATSTIYWSGLYVYGNGTNPFPESNCGTFAEPKASPVPLIVPEQELGNALQDANEALESVDVPLNAPDGSPILPSETGELIFSYAKWITSPTAAQELMGPFAPVYYHVGYLLGADVALVGLYMIVYGAVYLIRWVVWMYKSIIQIISTIGSLTVPGIILLLIIFGVLFLGWLATAVFQGAP